MRRILYSRGRGSGGVSHTEPEGHAATGVGGGRYVRFGATPDRRALGRRTGEVVRDAPASASVAPSVNAIGVSSSVASDAGAAIGASLTGGRFDEDRTGRRLHAVAHGEATASTPLTFPFGVNVQAPLVEQLKSPSTEGDTENETEPPSTSPPTRSNDTGTASSASVTGTAATLGTSSNALTVMGTVARDRRRGRR